MHTQGICLVKRHTKKYIHNISQLHRKKHRKNIIKHQLHLITYIKKHTHTHYARMRPKGYIMKTSGRGHNKPYQTTLSVANRPTGTARRMSTISMWSI